MSCEPSDSTGRRQARPERAERLGRRSMLTGVAGAIGYVTGSVSAGPAALAANGDPVVLGESNRGSATTIIRGVRRGITTLRVRATGRTGVAIEARSPNVAVLADGGEHGTGLHGQSVFEVGVSARSLFGAAMSAYSSDGVGVDGESVNGDGVSGISRFGRGVSGANISEDQPAVVGWAQNGSTGVQGIATTGEALRPSVRRDTGVHGIGDAKGGTGVLAESSAGAALRVKGRAVFSRSGSLVVDAGSDRAVRTGISLTAGSSVLAVLRDHHPGVHVEAAVPDPTADAFTVYLNRRVDTAAEVAWFVLG